jgi:hypothetical protein
MRNHIRSNVVGYVALFFAIAGVAYAADVAPKDSVVSKSIKDGQVKTQDLADGAVVGPKVSSNSLTGDQIDESSLSKVPSAAQADSAANATQLGGQPASGFQQRVNGTCGGGTTISSIQSNGAVACSSAVFPIVQNLTAGGDATSSFFGPSNLVVSAYCHVMGSTLVRMYNFGPGTATLDWLYSNGATTVNASGASIPHNGNEDFAFNQTRLEGQFIFADGAGVTTVNLHFFDAGTSCQLRGTAEYAANP